MLNDKVVVITGGAGLIGLSFVKAVVKYGGIAIIADIIDNNEFKKRLNEAKIKDNKIFYLNIDITSKESIEKSIEILNNKYTKIDALVNNAYPRNPMWSKNNFFNFDYKDFCENVNMHMGGYVLTSQQFAKYFINQGYGNIISISSIQGVYAPKFDTYEGTNMDTPIEYSMIKSGVCHMTKYMAKYLANRNIRVNAIAPGGIFNNQPKNFLDKYRSYCTSKGMLDPEDIAGTLVFLLSDSSKYINGQILVVDDGWGL